MADILPFQKPARHPKKTKGSTLCKEGHHKWRIVKNQVFDTKQGRLVTVYECERCKARKNKAL